MKKLTSFISRFKVEILLSLISFIVVCCSNTKSASLTPAQTDVSIAQAHWAGTTLADLNKGYSLFADKCTQCHGMKNPKDFSTDDWTNDYMPDMGKRAHLSQDDYNLILHYILAKREELTSVKN
jgi:cytochrome c5